MKKIFLFVVCFWCSLTSFAQSIRYDGYGGDGRHQISGTLKSFNLDYGICHMGLKVYETDTEKDWRFLVCSTREYTKDFIVLIKLSNGHVMELKTDSVQTSDFTNPRVTMGTGFVQPGGMVNTFSYNSGSTINTWYTIEARLKPEQLDSICNLGISKIRIGNKYSYDGKEWNKDKLGKYIANTRKKLQFRLDNPLIGGAPKVRATRSIHTNF
jgi:hypothetical protein